MNFDERFKDLDSHIQMKIMKELDYLIYKYENQSPHVKHECAMLYYPFIGKNVEIDVEIVPLMKEMWKAGIHTSNSCQNNVPRFGSSPSVFCKITLSHLAYYARVRSFHSRNHIWIDFCSSNDMKKLLEILFKGVSEEHDVCKRALLKKHYSKGSWKYDMCLSGITQYDIIHSACGHCEECQDSNSEYDIPVEPIEIICMGVSLRFPDSDLEFVVQKLKEYNISC